MMENKVPRVSAPHLLSTLEHPVSALRKNKDDYI
jgi:hypothetical protein